MVTPYQRPSESCTIEQVAAWIVATEQKRLEIYHRLTEPLYSILRDQSVQQMSDLVRESIEEVRVLCDTLQADSEALRTHAQQLREQSTALCERSALAREQRVQQGPSVEEIHAAEQPMLDMFKDSLHSAVSSLGAPGPRVRRAS